MKNLLMYVGGPVRKCEMSCYNNFFRKKCVKELTKQVATTFRWFGGCEGLVG